MITWVKLKDYKWLFKKGEATKELDNFKQLYLWSTFSGISDEDIIAAQISLNENETHNYAEFDMKNRFTLSGKV